MFNEGYSASRATSAHRVCARKPPPGQLLTRLLPTDDESAGLTAMLLTHAAVTRLDVGDLVLLDQQDRTRWDRPLIDDVMRLDRPPIGHDRPLLL